MKRPPLTPGLSPTEFRAHRWLKAELIDFCVAHGLSPDGNKHTLRRRVMLFLKSGAVPERG